MAMKIWPVLIYWAVVMGYISYEWNAGVLGGLLQTEAFQSAMKIRYNRFAPDMLQCIQLTIVIDTRYKRKCHDYVLVPPHLMVWLRYCRLAMEQLHRSPHPSR
jgi:hypothetical protein